MGAGGAAFAAVDSILLAGLPVQDPEGLIVAWSRNDARGFPHVPYTPEMLERVTEGLTTLGRTAGVEAAGARSTVAEGPGGELVLRHVRVTGDFFGVLGASPAAGRLLTAADDRAGAAPVAVLSHGAWESAFGGDPRVVGSTLDYGGQSYTVVGVAPSGLDLPRGTQVWATVRGAFPDYATDPPVGIELDLVGRLAASATREAAAQETTAAVQDPDRGGAPSLASVVVPLEDHLFGPVRPVLLGQMAGALLLLLTGTGNLTLLLLATGRTSVREAAVRRALGAGRGDVLSRTLAEGGLIALPSLVLGLGLAHLGISVLTPLAPPDLRMFGDVSLSGIGYGVVAGVGLAASTGAALVAGLLLSRMARTSSVLSEGRGAPSGGRVPGAIVAAQFAFAVVVAVGSGLLARSVAAMQRLELGFAAEDLTVVHLEVPYGYFQVPDSWFGTLEAVTRGIGGRGGVEAATAGLSPPFASGLELVLRAEGQPTGALDASPYGAVEAVLPGYFEALGIELLSGRTLEEGDNRPESDRVAVVSETAARILWPGEDPLGRRLWGFGDRESRWTVVGVVADTRYRDYLERRPAVYYPMRRLGVAPPSTLLVRSPGASPATVRRLVDEAVADVPAARVLSVERGETLARGPSSRARFASFVLAAFASVSLLLAGTGVYGVFSSWVASRHGEMGVRQALGARAVELVRLVLGGVLKVAGVGILVGAVVSYWAARVLEGLLFGVTPADPPTLGAVGAAALALAALAGLAPALRAARTDPASSLRSH